MSQAIRFKVGDGLAVITLDRAAPRTVAVLLRPSVVGH
jgi:hypothetical protein